MATLNQGDINVVKFEDIKPIDSVVGLWVVTLRSSSDLLKVPRLGTDSNYSVNSLTKGYTATFYSSTKGETLVQLTGPAGAKMAVATLHRQGLSNNLTVRRGVA
jgi:hypothetical protein